jgi:5-methylthioadenosine/S-adenosylhomocysteine deaminase
MKSWLTNATLITMDPDRRVIDRGWLSIEADRIAALGAMTEYPASAVTAEDRVIDLAGRHVLPGLVNTHTHLFQELLKGLGDDRVLVDWFRQVTGPSAVALQERDCYLAAKLGALEAIRSGVTTLLDYMYPHHQKGLSVPIIEALIETDVRAIFARGYIDYGREYGIPPELIEDYREVIADVESLHSRFEGANGGRLRIGVAPCMIWSQTREGLMAVRELADAKRIPISIHVAETAYELSTSLQRFGKKDLAFLESIGFLGGDVLAVHCVHLDEMDLAILKARDVKVSHNPVSNMYLASGVAPIPEMISLGITVGLATDGSASNNNQNLLSQLKAAALLHKVHRGDATCMTAEKVLEMATIDGARALGLDDGIGSLEAGKKADLCAVNLKTAFAVPVHNPVSALVYSAIGQEAELVMVNGKILMEEGRLLLIDEAALLDEVTEAARKLAERAGTAAKVGQGWRSAVCR